MQPDGIVVLCNDDPYAKSTLPELSKLDRVKDLIYLDIGKKKIANHKTLYYDKSGKLIE